MSLGFGSSEDEFGMNAWDQAVYDLKNRYIGRANKNFLTLPYILNEFTFLQDPYLVAPNGNSKNSKVGAYENRIQMPEIEHILQEANKAAAPFPRGNCCTQMNYWILGISIGVMLVGLFLAPLGNFVGLLSLVGLLGIVVSICKSIYDGQKKNEENEKKRSTAVRGALDRLNSTTFLNSYFTTKVDSRGEYIRIDVFYGIHQKPNIAKYQTPDGNKAGGNPNGLVANQPMGKAFQPTSLMKPHQPPQNPRFSQEPTSSGRVLVGGPMGMNQPQPGPIPMAPGIAPNTGLYMNHGVYPTPPGHPIPNRPVPRVQGYALNQIQPAI